MIFQKNIEALKNNNPELAEQLSTIDINSIKDKFFVTKATSGDAIMLHNRIVLDSPVNPQISVSQSWDSQIKHSKFKNTDTIFVFGLGIGYMLKKAAISTQARIVLFEPEIDVIRFVLEYVDLSPELNQSGIFITNSTADCSKYISEKYLTNDILEVICNPCYQYSYMKEFGIFTDTILHACQNKLADIQTATIYNSTCIQNIIGNIYKQNDYIPFNFLNGKFSGKTALIAAAGPSLKKDVELIKSNRNKFVIFAVNRIYEYLVSEGINPDFTVFADALSCDELFKNGVPEKLDTNILMTLRTDVFCSQLNVNNRFLLFGKNDTFSKILYEQMPELIELTETSQTTTGLAYYAAKMLGFSKIIFEGLDLAFKDDVMYADSTKTNVQDDTLVINKYNSKKIVYLDSFKKEKIRSREDYAIFVHELGDIFKQENNIKIYNTTDFGANIDGMIYCNLEKILNENGDSEYISILNSLFDSSFTTRREQFIKKMNHILGKIKNEISEIKKTILNRSKKDTEILQDIISNSLLEPTVEREILNILDKLQNKTAQTELSILFNDIFNKTLSVIETISALKRQYPTD